MTPHFPGFLATLNKSVTVSDAARNLYTLTSMTSFSFSKSAKSRPDMHLKIDHVAGFVTVLALSYAIPVKRQQEFVASRTRQQARQLCEDFITSSAILRLDSAISLPELIDEYSEVQKVKE